MKEILSNIFVYWLMIGAFFAGLSFVWTIIQAIKAARIIRRGKTALLTTGKIWPPESDSTRMCLSIIGRFGLLPFFPVVIMWPYYLYVFWKNARCWNFVKKLETTVQEPESAPAVTPNAV